MKNFPVVDFVWRVRDSEISEANKIVWLLKIIKKSLVLMDRMAQHS